MRIDWAAAIGIVVVLAIPATAAAEDSQRFGQQILEILLEEGTIDEQRYEELVILEATESLPAVSSDPMGWETVYKNGLQLRRNDGNVRFEIGGRMQADFAVIDVDGALESAVPDSDGVGAELRRARFYMSGELYKRIIWKSQIDFGRGEIRVDDMYVGMTGLGILGTAKVGHQKEPYSLEELTSSKNNTFMERSISEVLATGRRDTGLNLSNTLFEKRMTWSAGIFAPADNKAGKFFSGDPEFNVSARVTGLPIYSDEGRFVLHFGLAGSYQYRDDSEFEYRQRPEMHLAERYVDSGPLTTNGTSLLGLELAAVAGPFYVASEWKQTWIDVPAAGTATLFGGYVMAGFFLTGEHRPYEKSSAIWSPVHPLAPFDPQNGQWGAFEIATRFSYVDANDKAIRGGKERNIDVALNWYLFSNVRISANYLYADVDGTGIGTGTNASGKIHGFQTRAQIAF